ncbi:MAG TPA: hypothetical protein PLY88_09385 [Candidatus Omnitrophota bacterium]|nr:hypothetical protein [Candidatus Omnitrophota bacterium]
MIKINLLPPELRPVKKSKSPKASAPGVPALVSNKQMVLGGGLAVAVVFFAVTLLFYFDYLGLKGRLVKVNQDFAAIQPSVQEVRSLEQEVSSVLQAERDFLNAHILNKAALTSILQTISESLPEGVWLTALSINNSGKKRSFQIQGVVSGIKDKTNIQQIEDYLHQVKMVIPSSHFVYSTGKQLADKVSATAFTANFEWQAD